MQRILPALLLTGTALAQGYFAASLDGAQQVPPLAVAGRGFGIVRFDPATSQVRIYVHHEGLSGAPTAAGLHQGAPGVNGPVLLPLAAATSGSYTAAAVLTPSTLSALLGNQTYLTVHTAANPGGEIRGQVVPARSTRFTGVLSGAQAVPANTSTAQGRVVAWLHEPENRLVYDVETTGLGTVTAAHVHLGAVGSNGPIVFPLVGTGGSFAGVSGRLPAAQVASLLADGAYADVHTTLFPGGELRTQLTRDQGDHFVAALDGAQQVPPAPGSGQGGASIVVRPTGSIYVSGTVAGVSGAPTTANVHAGAAGLTGPVVFALALNGTTFSGSHTPTAADLATLRAGSWYVSVATTSVPGGELRGQFAPALLPAPAGAGCMGSNGMRPATVATRVPALGTTMTLDLYGGLANGIALLAFGASRDLLAGAIPLPAELSSLGLPAPGCHLFVDPLQLVLQLTNALGTASTAVDVPVLPALRGQRFHAQWFSLDPAANASGFVGSNALTLPIQ